MNRVRVALFDHRATAEPIRERRTIKLWVEAGAPYGVPSTDTSLKSKPERIELGKRLFVTICASCHQPTGQGLPNQFPPLAASDFLNADKQRAIRIVVNGLQGELVVNGQKFNNSMPRLPLSDQEIANVLTYVYCSFGNSGKEVTPDQVRAVRKEKQEARVAGQIQRAKAAAERSPFE